MHDDVYRQLAQRLDTIPNGFSATESGVELRLLARIFTPEEALLAAAMSTTYESADTIAARVGMDARAAQRTLKGMARRGLIYAGKGDRRLTFRLMPFVVGFYEEQLPRMDRELAELFEAYIQETHGGSIYSRPAVHRVIPVEEAVPLELEIYPYERATVLVESAKSWAVRNCICRVQKRLIGEGCEHEVENCLVFAPVEGAFDHSELNRAISREEALDLLRETEEAGLVHTTGNYRDEHHYICNCCSCCCGVLRGVTEFGIHSAVDHSRFRALSDADLCAGCEDCVERCPFGALSVPEDVCVVDVVRCVGCGQCVSVCPSEALQMIERPQEEIPPLATDRREWTARRAQARGLSISEI